MQTTIDWDSLIYRGSESKDLDYKAPCMWNTKDKKACCELVKDILAMANTKGGWLIIGVEEKGNGFNPIGVTSEQASSFESTRLADFLNKYADPPINPQVHKPTVKDKTYVAIQISPFPDTPHICQKSFEGVLSSPALYVRTDNNASAPLKNSADFRAIIEASIRNRTDTLLSTFRSILTHGPATTKPVDAEFWEKLVDEFRSRAKSENPHEQKQYGHRVSVFYPETHQPLRFNNQELEEMMLNASVDLRGFPFVFISQTRTDLYHTMNDGWECFDSKEHFPSGGDAFHYWRIHNSGLLFAQETLREDSRASVNNTPADIFRFESFSIMAIEAILCLVKLYEDRIDDDENVVFRFELTGIGGRRLSRNDSFSSIFSKNNYICHEPAINYKQIQTYAEWRAGQVDHAVNLCDHVFRMFNWRNPDLYAARTIIEKVLARQYF